MFDSSLIWKPVLTLLFNNYQGLFVNGREFIFLIARLSDTLIKFVKMVQSVIVGIFFIAALAYLGRLLVKVLFIKSPSSCDSGCGKCGTLDFDKIERQLKEKGI